VFDVDPYGTCAPFIDSVLKKAKNGSLICLTSTDMRVLAKHNFLECYRRYHSFFPSNNCQKEVALRIFIHFVFQKALDLKMHVRPVASLSLEHYIRVFFIVDTNGCQKAMDDLHLCGYAQHCPQCFNFTSTNVFDKSGKCNPKMNSQCSVCSSEMKFGGPLWLGALHDDEFLKAMLVAVQNVELVDSNRVKAILNLVLNEVSEAIFPYEPTKICKSIKCPNPKMGDLWACIENSGFKISYCLSEKGKIKTNADYKTFIKALRSCTKPKTDDPNFKNNVQHESVYNILTKIPLDIEFDKNLKKDSNYHEQRVFLADSAKVLSTIGPMTAV